MMGGAGANLARLIIPMRAVSEDTIKSANSLAVILGSRRSLTGARPMEDFLASASLGRGRELHIATLSRQTIADLGAEHLGFGGYFVFETTDEPGLKGINILGKASSFEAAIRLADLWQDHSRGP